MKGIKIELLKNQKFAAVSAIQCPTKTLLRLMAFRETIGQRESQVNQITKTQDLEFRKFHKYRLKLSYWCQYLFPKELSSKLLFENGI